MRHFSSCSLHVAREQHKQWARVLAHKGEEHTHSTHTLSKITKENIQADLWCSRLDSIIPPESAHTTSSHKRVDEQSCS
jgi:hypothetical protein